MFARHTNSVGVILYLNNSETTFGCSNSRRKISALFPIEVPVAMCCLMIFYVARSTCAAIWASARKSEVLVDW